MTVPRSMVAAGVTIALVLGLAVALLGGVKTAGPAGAVGGRALDVFVTDVRGVPLYDATVVLDGQAATTDHYGRARLTDVAAGSVTVSHVRHPSRTVDWTGSGDRLRVPLGSPTLRAFHVAGTLPGTAHWDGLLTLADRTAVNAFMLDMKDESGRVFPHTSSSLAVSAGSAVGAWDFATVVAELHARDLAVISRIVTFQDPIVGREFPHLAVQTSPGVPFSRRGLTFLDPTDAESRAYALELAVEACAAGVDEVQFDYVRYPDGAPAGAIYDGASDEAGRVATIVSFLSEARDLLPGECRVAADIFGFITSIPGDGGIGQQLEALAQVADVLSPMAYPNHWGRGWFGFRTPADHPGEVIDASMRDALVRVGGAVTIRPWLQDFGGYGPDEVRAQIEAADALGLGWMVWNAGSVFTEAGFPTEAEMRTPSSVPDAVEEFLPSSGYWDVPDGTTYAGDVAWLGANGITNGCNPPWRDDFCPNRTLTRAEAATMLVRALGLPPSPVDRFSDDDGTSHEEAINSLAAAGITRGCAAESFCPHQPLNRAQMAALIARALDLPPAPGNTFVDDDGLLLEPDIERIAAAGITRGCATDRFCPNDPVPREQVAAFFHRALA